MLIVLLTSLRPRRLLPEAVLGVQLPQHMKVIICQCVQVRVLRIEFLQVWEVVSLYDFLELLKTGMKLCSVLI
jgi:hypothetical protein